MAAVKAKNALVTNAEKRVREVCGSTNYNYVTIFVDEAKAFGVPLGTHALAARWALLLLFPLGRQ